MKRSREDEVILKTEEEQSTPPLQHIVDDDDDGCVGNFKGRTGPLPSKIKFSIIALPDDMVKIRVDDEANPEFWLEGYILTKTLKRFIGLTMQ